MSREWRLGSCKTYLIHLSRRVSKSSSEGSSVLALDAGCTYFSGVRSLGFSEVLLGGDLASIAALISRSKY